MWEGEGVMRRSGLARATIKQIIGDPRTLDEELNQYRRDSALLSSRDLIRKYAKRWIAIYGGKVRAEARSMEEVLEKADSQGLPRDRIVVQYIDDKPRTM